MLNSDEEKASNESDAEDEDGERSEEDVARANYARYKEDDLARRATLFDGVKVTDISYSDPDPTSLQYVSDSQGVPQADSDNSLQDMYASYELRANNYLIRLQEQDSNAYIGETMEASPITLLPRLNDREIAYVVAAYNDNSRLREHYRCRYMPRCADVFYRRVLEIVYFMSQYFYSFSLQRKIRDIMPDVMYDRDNICDLHAIVQSRVKRLMKRKPSRDATSTERKIHQQDLAAWQSFLHGILQYTLPPVPYSHRCSEYITTPRLPLLPLPDVAFKAPCGWNHSPSRADTTLPVSSNAQASGPHPGTRQATSLARGANDPTVIETVTSRRPRNQGHLTGPTHLGPTNRTLSSGAGVSMPTEDGEELTSLFNLRPSLSLRTSMFTWSPLLLPTYLPHSSLMDLATGSKCLCIIRTHFPSSWSNPIHLRCTLTHIHRTSILFFTPLTILP